MDRAAAAAELSVYTWPEIPYQDALRRSPEVDLSPAIGYYQGALADAPSLASANRRLGQIELSRGDYAAARQHLLAAYRSAPDQQANRFLLGESYAIAGQLPEAVALWHTVAAQSGPNEDNRRPPGLPCPPVLVRQHRRTRSQPTHRRRHRPTDH